MGDRTQISEREDQGAGIADKDEGVVEPVDRVRAEVPGVYSSDEKGESVQEGYGRTAENDWRSKQETKEMMYIQFHLLYFKDELIVVDSSMRKGSRLSRMRITWRPKTDTRCYRSSTERMCTVNTVWCPPDGGSLRLHCFSTCRGYQQKVGSVFRLPGRPQWGNWRTEHSHEPARRGSQTLMSLTGMKLWCCQATWAEPYVGWEDHGGCD